MLYGLASLSNNILLFISIFRYIDVDFYYLQIYRLIINYEL